MTDREKVIRGLEHCRKYGTLGGLDCNGHYEYTDNLQDIIKANNHRKDCLYGKCRTGCVVTLVDEAIALLKEHEAVKPVRDKETGRLWLCGNCGSYVGFEDNDPYDQNEFDKFCRECGRPVLWEGR